MTYTLEFDREDDGRWIAEVLELPGVLAYGSSWAEAKSKVEALARSVLEQRRALEHQKRFKPEM
jgi:predicted RNase H-like HicB family nuclease